jgi:hypothetical protein
MQTAMQEFIEYLEKAYYINELTNFDEDKIQFLEKEKEQIIDAYYGNIDGVYGYREAGEEYYNQTYNL